MTSPRAKKLLREIGISGDGPGQALPAIEAALLSARNEALEQPVKLLQQALGLIVEFGDLNGFRNLSNNELGALVRSIAMAIGAYLNEVAPVTPEQAARVRALKQEGT